MYVTSLRLWQSFSAPIVILHTNFHPNRKWSGVIFGNRQVFCPGVTHLLGWPSRWAQYVCNEIYWMDLLPSPWILRRHRMLNIGDRLTKVSPRLAGRMAVHTRICELFKKKTSLRTSCFIRNYTKSLTLLTEKKIITTRRLAKLKHMKMRSHLPWSRLFDNWKDHLI